jgi:hypothetical protein
MLQNNIIKSNRNIQTKSGFIANGTTYNFSASLNNNSFNKKYKNSYSIGYSINDPNFILNATSNNLFSYYSFLRFININKSFNVSIRNEISSKLLKLKFEQSIRYNDSKNYISQNNILLPGTTKSIALENKIKSKFVTSFNFDWSNSFTYSINKTSKNPTHFTNYVNISTLLINLNYMKRSHVDFSFRDFYFYTPYSKQKNHLMFVNVSFKQLLNQNKIRLTLEFNNVTNRRKFANQVVSATQYNEVSTTLIPFYAIAKIEFLL